MLTQFPVAMQDGHSPTSATSKAGSDDCAPLDSAERKKKNADAQAAFRARRANYIATLEETGESHRAPPCPARPLTPAVPAPPPAQSPISKQS